MRNKLIALITVAVVAVVAIVTGVKMRTSPGEAARKYADTVAADLAANRLPTGVRNGDANAFAATLSGMGDLREQVSVKDVHLDGDKKSGTVTFDHSWTVHQGQPAWTYTTTMPIARGDKDWSGTWSNSVLAPGLKDTERLSADRLVAKRGDITSGDGKAMVTSRPVERVGIDRSKVSSAATAKTSAKALAKLVDVDGSAYAKQVSAAGDKAFTEAIVYRTSSADFKRISPKLKDIPGATAVADTRSLAPTTTFAAPILGRAGEATSDDVKKSDGAVRAGDVVGQSGLQATQNSRLAGTAGYAVRATPTGGGAARTLKQVAPTAGKAVRTTLDQRLQTLAESALAKVKPASAVVAIRPSDGHVLAAASGPGSQGYSTATLGQYAPGSTFKTVSSLALLRSGLTPSSTVSCNSTTTVAGRSFKNYDQYPSSHLGRIPFRDAFAQSCNTAFISSRTRLNADSLNRAASAFGLDATPTLGVPASLATVPKTTGATDLASSMIGQGKVVVTPLAMATVAAGIGAGHPVKPSLVTDPAQKAKTTTTPKQPVTGTEGSTLRTLMRRVVTEGSGTALQDVPGKPVVAKTGTAEYGNANPPRSHAWMIAVQGDLAVAVMIADGSGGAKTAGPVMKTFLTGANQGK